MVFTGLYPNKYGKDEKSHKETLPFNGVFYEPSLKALDALGGSGSTGEIYKKVLSIVNLSNEVIDEMHSFTMSEVEYRLMWARTGYEHRKGSTNHNWSIHSRS